MRSQVTHVEWAVVDAHGLPVTSRSRAVRRWTIGSASQTMLLADRGYDADWIQGACPPARSVGKRSSERNRIDPICLSRNLIEQLFNKIKQCRRVATQ
jgi:transposase